MPKQIVEELKRKGFKIKLASELKEEDRISTNIFLLDYLLDGGIPQKSGGFRCEFYGKESSGKTTFTLYVIKRFLELGKKVVYLNAEKSYDKLWAEKIGIDNKKVHIAEPNTLEEAGDMIVEFVNDYDLIIIDSIPSLIPEEESLDDMRDKKFMASQSKVFAPMTRKIYSAIGESMATIIFLNQIREKVGIMFGNPEMVPGGHALLHLYNARVEFKLGKPIENEDKEKIGYEINLRCTKNKSGTPHRQGIVDFYFKNGVIDNRKTLFFFALKYSLITLSGMSYTYKDKKFVGKEKAMQGLTEEDYKDIETELLTLIKNT